MVRWGSQALLIVCLGVLLAQSGCLASSLGGSSDKERPATLALNNSANVTQTFEVFIVEVGATVKTELNDGRTGNWTIGQGLSTVGTSGEYYVTVEPPESARLYGRYTLEPGEVNRSSIEELATDAAIVVVLHQNGKIGWWASVYCSDGVLVGFEAVTRPSKTGGDAWAGYSCHNTLL